MHDINRKVRVPSQVPREASEKPKSLSLLSNKSELREYNHLIEAGLDKHNVLSIGHPRKDHAVTRTEVILFHKVSSKSCGYRNQKQVPEPY